MFKLHIRTNKLSDGSETYDVVLRDLESDGAEKSRAVMDFQAVTLKDAIALVDKFQEAVEAHTNEDISVWSA